MRGVTARRPVSLALAGLAALTVGLTGCSGSASTVAEPSAGASSEAHPLAGQTMPGAELAALWDSPGSYPCAQPGPLFGDALKPLADSMKDLPSVDSVKPRLAAVTARGTYISEDLGNLHAALLQTRYDMVDIADHQGVDAPTVKLFRDNFGRYLEAVVSDLQSGAAPTSLTDFEFDMAGSCGR